MDGNMSYFALIEQDLPPDSVVVPCSLQHRVKFCLVRLPRKEQPLWWQQDVMLPYKNEKFLITTTATCEQGKLDGLGEKEFLNIPAGSNDFQCPEFYTEINNWLKSKIK